MPRVALFVTCVVDAFAPDAGVATVKLLRAAGRTVEVPDGQTCCGQPAANAGFAADAARVAATTLEALDGALVAGAEAVGLLQQVEGVFVASLVGCPLLGHGLKLFLER